MQDSCCICGLHLAMQDSELPQWRKDIRALCQFDNRVIISCEGGFADNDAFTFNLPLPMYGFQKFCSRRTFTRESDLEDPQDYCYPFHAACWSLLQETDGDNILECADDALFDIFESFHYDRTTRAMRWGQGYHFDDFLDCSPSREIWNYQQSCEQDLAVLADPLSFTIHEEVIPRSCSIPIAVAAPGVVGAYRRRIHPHTARHCLPFGLLLLPSEIIESIMFSLDFDDVEHLITASTLLYRRYGRGGANLPPSFWTSRFRAQGEMAFARTIRPLPCPWKEWFFKVRSGLRDGPNRMNLRNRQRIWKLGAELTSMVRAIKEPDRRLCGQNIAPPKQLRGPIASCLALKYDSEGCRELKRSYVSFGNSSLCGLIPSYVFVSNQRLISGLTFKFENGEYIDVGYIRNRHIGPTGSEPPVISPKVLRLLFSPAGFVDITTDAYPPDFPSGDRLAVAKWSLHGLKGICLGLDAIRIVQISINGPEQITPDAVVWTHPAPTFSPSLTKSDLTTLYDLQAVSFRPASAVYIEPKKGHLIAIKIHSALGPLAGIAGIRFVYDTGLESAWGTSDDVASLTFFLDKTERLVKVKAYQIGSLVCHLQFSTSLSRTSDLFPQPQIPYASIECITHASINGDITGFCGCFVESKKLKCFGIMASNSTRRSSSFSSIQASDVSKYTLREMPLGGIQNHGSQLSCLVLANKYCSVQASVNPAPTKYRPAGHITGLLLYPSNDIYHPDLIGQWTGPGETYNLREDEVILELKCTTIKPTTRIQARPGLTQIAGLTLFTNQRRISWNDPSTYEDTDIWQITWVSWEFNAIFDRLQNNLDC